MQVISYPFIYFVLLMYTSHLFSPFIWIYPYLPSLFSLTSTISSLLLELLVLSYFSLSSNYKAHSISPWNSDENVGLFCLLIHCKSDTSMLIMVPYGLLLNWKINFGCCCQYLIDEVAVVWKCFVCWYLYRFKSVSVVQDSFLYTWFFWTCLLMNWTFP